MSEGGTVWSWRRLGVAAVAAVLTILAGDALVRAYVPTSVLGLREAGDGVYDLWRKNPDILILGSSHARTFHALGKSIERRSHGATRVVSIPLELGRMVPYEWLLENRIGPLVDEKLPDGRKKRDHLKEFILLTEWWDTCPPDGYYGNLPSRAWRFTDFVADVETHGFTGYNRNYMQRRWQRFWGASAFSRIRKSDDYAVAVRRILGGDIDDVETRTHTWQRMIEDAVQCLGDPEQMRALDKIVAFAKDRGLGVTIILFPRKPSTFTTVARNTTLVSMHDLMSRFADSHGVRLIDMTLSTPLGDGDFMADFDHVNAAGNRKFIDWALEGDLHWMLD
ncbi:MAG TPA: SGNH/GDSL hydrolase family protein, partial [Candidatus Polarisedimenticolia bacterium]|nr:SGNH/GDSL hydrolase family protein [Candidatus Polarisedimenticolia bacterium]